MKYTIDKIIDRSTQHEFVFFWGHRPSKNGQISKSCFSQWWSVEFTIDGIIYHSAEQYMMAMKAKLFEDKDILEKILMCKTPIEAKKLGRKVKGFDLKQWAQQSYDIVKKGKYYKFKQNKPLLDFLLKTSPKVIVEASPVDPIWGIGLAEDHKDVHNPTLWKGKNLLGFALMEVRDELMMPTKSDEVRQCFK